MGDIRQSTKQSQKALAATMQKGELQKALAREEKLITRVKALKKDSRLLKEKIRPLKEDIENRKNYEGWLQSHDRDTPMRCYNWWLEQQALKGKED